MSSSDTETIHLPENVVRTEVCYDYRDTLDGDMRVDLDYRLTNNSDVTCFANSGLNDVTQLNGNLALMLVTELFFNERIGVSKVRVTRFSIFITAIPLVSDDEIFETVKSGIRNAGFIPLDRHNAEI